MAAQYGLDTLKGDVDATIRTFGRVSGPIVLAGHSYGGTVITHAGMDPRVAALVYIAALGPDETETSQSIQAKFPTTDVFKNIDVADGRVWLKPGTGVPCFGGDLSAEEQDVVYATHFAPAADLFTQKLDGIAWRSKPSRLAPLRHLSPQGALFHATDVDGPDDDGGDPNKPGRRRRKRWEIASLYIKGQDDYFAVPPVEPVTSP
jgi:pimeloyl-ACP methyl ester carboxylesterase